MSLSRNLVRSEGGVAVFTTVDTESETCPGDVDLERLRGRLDMVVCFACLAYGLVDRSTLANVRWEAVTMSALTHNCA
jgi:hypothetical protein